MTEYIKAKEYLKAQCEKRKDSLVLEMPQNYITDVEQAFIDGYHECQKKHEWHYVKDGDLPKDTKTVLALCIVGGEPYPYLAQYWKGSTTAKKNGVDLNWNCWLNNMQREVVEPYAWKEIVLPKESE